MSQKPLEVDRVEVVQRLGWDLLEESLSQGPAQTYQVRILTASHVVQASPVETVHPLAELTRFHLIDQSETGNFHIPAHVTLTRTSSNEFTKSDLVPELWLHLNSGNATLDLVHF